MVQKYIGITPYDENCDYKFTGRSEETWSLYERIIRNDYTVYYATSGEGKSSLIRAGLVPILRRRDFFPVYIVFEEKELENLGDIEQFIVNRINIEAEKNNVTYEQSELSKSRFNPETSSRLKDSMWWRLRNYCFKRGEVELKPLYIFDQFEEIFTKASYDATDSFFSWLERISTDYIPDTLSELASTLETGIPTQKTFKALFSFRSEYLGDLDYWCVQKHFIPSLQENRIDLRPLTPRGAREIINLNESLGKYADKLIQGCAQAKSNTNDENQPCVYAMILSVVCHTLSEMTDNERVQLLDNLNKQQEKTIDDILLRFYRQRLQDIRLDYDRDEKVISKIEDALVDESGRRRRRRTDEITMQSLSQWITPLCEKKNGLLKIIGTNRVDGENIHTVEFPHDRLCKAIDSSRKERQGKISWRLGRQIEWMQFSFISIIIGITAFIWDALIPRIAPLIGAAENFKDTVRLLVKYFAGEKPEYQNELTTLILMVSLILFIPLITLLIFRKSKKWQITNAIISFLGFGILTFLWGRFKDEFSNNYVTIFTLLCITYSFVCLCVSLYRLKTIYSKGEHIVPVKSRYSYWPLWGGYLFFAFFLLYECLVNTAIGVSEPVDSCWAPAVIPLLYTLCSWGFLNIDFDNRKKPRVITAFLISVLILAVLFVIGIISYENSFKRVYGLLSCIVLILLWIAIYAYMIWQAKSNTMYYTLSKSKRLIATALGCIIIILTYFLHLGYNPICINPKTVWHVNSWRDVTIFAEDSISTKKYGILYSTDGRTIIPCCADTIYSPFSYITSNFESSPFIYVGGGPTNNDKSLVWDEFNHTVKVGIWSFPILEEHLHRYDSTFIEKKALTLKDSIDYYAANLFSEIRKANIKYVLEGKPYSLDDLGSIEILDSLQHIALTKELSKFSINAQDSVSTSNNINSLGDSDLIDFLIELSRSYLLCLIKGRVLQSDMPSMYSLQTNLLSAYFNYLPKTDHLIIDADINFSVTINSDELLEFKKSYTIINKDLKEKKLFAYYNLFNLFLDTDTYNWLCDYYFEIRDNILGQNSLLDNLLDPLLGKQTPGLNFDKDKVLSNDEIIEKINNEFLNPLKSISEGLSSMEEGLSSMVAGTLKLLNYRIESEKSFERLRNDVLSVLINLLNYSNEGIYNNLFETIYRGFINVSELRGYDCEQYYNNLSEYYSKKNSLQKSHEKISIELTSMYKKQQEVLKFAKDIREEMTAKITLIEAIEALEDGHSK